MYKCIYTHIYIYIYLHRREGERERERERARARERERERGGQSVETHGPHLLELVCFNHQPSQFKQTVDLKISDLPCGRPQNGACHKANPRS